MSKLTINKGGTMFKIKLMPTVAVVVALLVASASAEYYYSGGRQIPLKVDSLKVTVSNK